MLEGKTMLNLGVGAIAWGLGCGPFFERWLPRGQIAERTHDP